MDKKRVVITGMGVVAANGNGCDEFTKALREGRSGIRFHEKLKELGFSCQVGGIPQGIDELKTNYFTPDALMAMNSNMLYSSIAGIDCYKDAGFEVPAPNSTETDWDTGAIIGTGIGGVDTLGEWVVPQVNSGKVRRLGSTTVEQTMSSGVSARLGGFLALGGAVTTNSSACTTGTEAVVQAFHAVREGRLERVLAGGSEGSSHYIWAGFDAMRVLSKNFNEDPKRASRPLSATAGGFVPSSGAGILMVESLDSARKRGAKIYAEIAGGHVNSGGQRTGGSMTAQNPDGVVRCIRKALQIGNINPAQVDLINGHLTATGADCNEVSNWNRALERSPEKMPWIQSTKSMIGHALGAAGGIECVASVLQIYYGFVHGSLNCEDLHPGISAYASRVATRTMDEPIKVVAKASFGFGDVNGCVIFKKFDN